ncbi:MAG TPA: hypothetical protein VGL72_04715 [Bryobacteraceae bacterium]|jgi:hypothetical protein
MSDSNNLRELRGSLRLCVKDRRLHPGLHQLASFEIVLSILIPGLDHGLHLLVRQPIRRLHLHRLLGAAIGMLLGFGSYSLLGVLAA